MARIAEPRTVTLTHQQHDALKADARRWRLFKQVLRNSRLHADSYGRGTHKDTVVGHINNIVRITFDSVDKAVTEEEEGSKMASDRRAWDLVLVACRSKLRRS